MSSESFDGAAKARIPNPSADPIADFYTNNPFPPPLEDLERALELYKDENVRRSEFFMLWPDREYRADLDVLVAGCGTWQAAKYALVHPDARVIAIDVSPTSLEHTEKLKQKYNLTNLDVRQLPIENAGDLDHTFDHIVCTGVLHHLADPDIGLRALQSVLKKDGAMYLMLYAPYGRTGVYMMQEYCRRLGVGTSPEEIRDLISVLKALPQNHPVLAAQGGAREFMADSIADALLNPRDRPYSVPQIFDFLERSELAFGRWYWQAAYLPQCGMMARTPHAAILAELPERERYAQMELWRGLMSNHSFVAYRNDADLTRAKIQFDDDFTADNYMAYVPVRLPWTMCVTQSLPPGAAGVLVNQTHVFQDTFVIVNTVQKALYDAIDGQRSIAQIMEAANESDSLIVLEFFKRLWEHDQVVFDTSKAK
ncbi:MAG TPA: class I SAM-dependent methyltransferase [Pyrinomonadaceae bacterium]|nr:class I SAM-dependent methyltransferase [Pyrinomonadaceae bacterium]